jgi:hypothetical protein
VNRDNIIAILGILKTAYPRFYANMKKNEAEETIALWQEMFSDTDIRILTIAVKRLITHLEFPPTIADVKKEIVKITSDNTNIMDYWQEAFEMICNASYMSLEEFEKYSSICKRFFGSVSNLRPYGAMERDYVLNNIQPRFLKYAETYKKEEKENLMLPAEYRGMINKLSNKFELKTIGGKRDEI